ncbi:stage V sporulation protein AA [Clostridium sp. D2Q-11]|uniref:Stage V sporulation protein AA n=1 Tax=Anaeromonas frigoriresistens TaxID=2683708 RepID=A0A942UXW9_9FIRM|nr:stage V sporulation protein AA [Anaeromonas frigoriresistens]MBS4539620.1 stage V sporulation protein AA [Anaeromonas frigoriresistens]
MKSLVVQLWLWLIKGWFIINNKELFLQIEPKVTMKPNSKIKLKDVASAFSEDKGFQIRIEDLHVGEVGNYDKNQVISLISLIKKIKEIDRDVNITVFGSPEILINITNDKKEISILKFLKIGVISLLLFFGAAIAIINFHDDVNMEDSLEDINYIVTGEREISPLYLKVPYSLGLGVGMVTFFNRLLRKKNKNEPSPLELEMHSYKKNIDDYILDITKHNKKGN